MAARAGGTGRPRKRFGQHFLSDRRILARIADALAIAPGDAVVEIGPGRGALTAELVERVGAAGRVCAIEVDRDLAAALGAVYGANAAVSVVTADVLEVDLNAHVTPPFLLIGNVPYNITTPIVFWALRPPRAERMVFLVQREVADRLGAAPGSRDYGALSVNVQAVARVERLFAVPPGAFTPPPKVDSAVVRIVPRTDPDVAPGDEPALRALVQRCFSMRRKQMVRIVREIRGIDGAAAAALLAEAGVMPTQRPEELSPATFVRLQRVLAQWPLPAST